VQTARQVRGTGGSSFEKLEIITLGAALLQSQTSSAVVEDVVEEGFVGVSSLVFSVKLHRSMVPERWSYRQECARPCRNQSKLKHGVCSDRDRFQTDGSSKIQLRGSMNAAGHRRRRRPAFSPRRTFVAGTSGVKLRRSTTLNPRFFFHLHEMPRAGRNVRNCRNRLLCDDQCSNKPQPTSPCKVAGSSSPVASKDPRCLASEPSPWRAVILILSLSMGEGTKRDEVFRSDA